MQETTILNGTAGLEATVEFLQQGVDAVNDAASYFECLGMESQTNQLNQALDLIEGVQDLLGVFLGTVDVGEAFSEVKPLKPV